MATLNEKTRVPLAWFFGFILICVPVTGWFLHLEWRLDAYAKDSDQQAVTYKLERDEQNHFIRSVDRRLKKIQIKMGIQDPPDERTSN